MSATSKIKWIGSIILGGFLILLALFGGNWGTSYAAEANLNPHPIIHYIDPKSVPAGSPDTIMIIDGENFGSMVDTAVRFSATDFDLVILPLQVIPNGISINITDTLLIEPNVITITVLWSQLGRVPTIPIDQYIEESNPAPFFVYAANISYLPVIRK